MKKLLWTDEEIKISYRDSGMTNTQIEILAQLNNCPRNVICKIVGKNTNGHWSVAKENKRIVDDNYKKMIVKYHAQGMTDIEIGKAMGKSNHYIGKLRETMNLPQIYKYELRPNIDDELMMKLFKQGYYDTEVARKTGLSLTRISEWRKKNGISKTKRKTKEWKEV